MAEQPTSDDKTHKVFDLNDPSIETIYANTTHIIVGEGDITIHLGFQPIEGNNVPATGVKRVVMTHDSFMRMMEFWAARYHLLESLYDGKPKTLRDIDNKIINAAFDKMLGRPEEGTNGNGTSDEPAEEAEPSGPADSL